MKMNMDEQHDEKTGSILLIPIKKKNIWTLTYQQKQVILR